VAACAEFGTDPGTEPNHDLRAADAGVDAVDPTDRDATVDGANANLGLLDDDFETGNSCLPWAAIRGALMTVDGGANRTARSCNACISDRSGGGHRDIRPTPPATTLPAGSYSFTVFVRSDSYQGVMSYELYSVNADGTRGNYLGSARVTVSKAWMPVQVATSTDKPVPGWFLDLYTDDGPSALGSCVQFDESVVEHRPL